MSLKHLNNFHGALKELFKTAPDIIEGQISFMATTGEILTVQTSYDIQLLYARNQVPVVNRPRQIFWKYDNDAFVDCAMALPAAVIFEVATEAKKRKNKDIIETEEVAQEPK